jgi:CheY-like chemotaxis protein
MNDQTKVTHLGLLNDEATVLKSIFNIDPKLQECFLLVEPNRVDEADVVLVNYDDHTACGLWDKIRQKNQTCIKVLIGNSIPEDEQGFALERPIRVRNLIKVFEQIIEDEHTNISFAGDNGGDKGELTQTVVYLSDESSFRVLVIDDSFPSRRTLEKKLTKLIKLPRKMSMSISFASNAQEALLKTSAKQYDLIFLESDMQGIDAFQVCKQIKGKQKVHIVLLKGKKSPLDAIRISLSECDASLILPVTDWRLQEELDKALRYKANVA